MKLNYNKGKKAYADKIILNSNDIHAKLKEIFGKDFPIEEDSDGNIEVDFGATIISDTDKATLLTWLKAGS